MYKAAATTAIHAACLKLLKPHHRMHARTRPASSLFALPAIVVIAATNHQSISVACNYCLQVPRLQDTPLCDPSLSAGCCGDCVQGGSRSGDCRCQSYEAHQVRG